jgi:catechol 2,3-dioxygenase-like lactoylglutathione lyase family enzyme
VDDKLLGHVAIRARNFEESLGFYADVLGFPEMLRYEYSDGSTLCAFLRVTDHHYIELFPDGAGLRAPGRFDTAINHFCFIVPDVDQTAADFAQKNVPIARELQTPEGRILFVQDPDGNLIEFAGPATAALQLGAAISVRRGNSPNVIRTGGMPPADLGRRSD